MVTGNEENPLFAEGGKSVRNYFSRRDLLIDRKQQKPSIVDVAEAYRDEIQRRGITQRQLAKQLGVSRVRVTQILNVLRLSKDVVEMARRDPSITERILRTYHAKITQ